LGHTAQYGMKNFVRSLIPPIAQQLRRKLFPIPPVPAYTSYQEALKYCGAGYDAQKVAATVVEKTKRYRDTVTDKLSIVTEARWTRLALGIKTAEQGGTLNCLDFGGAAGTDYLLAKQLFGDTIKFRWHVVETKALSQEANRFMANGELQFFDDLQAAVAAFDTPIDLLMSSGTIQCVPDALGTLRSICAVGAKHLFLTRTALADLPLNARTIVQKSLLSNNGPCSLPPGVQDEEVRYPATFADRREAEAILSENYRIAYRFEEDRGAYTIGTQPISMYGYLAVRL